MNYFNFSGASDDDESSFVNEDVYNSDEKNSPDLKKNIKYFSI